MMNMLPKFLEPELGDSCQKDWLPAFRGLSISEPKIDELLKLWGRKNVQTQAVQKSASCVPCNS